MTEKNERHHADMFLGLALAVHAAGLENEHRPQWRQVMASIAGKRTKVNISTEEGRIPRTVYYVAPDLGSQSTCRDQIDQEGPRLYIQDGV